MSILDYSQSFLWHPVANRIYYDIDMNHFLTDPLKWTKDVLMKGADTSCSVNIFVPQTSTGIVLGKLPTSKQCSLCTSELRSVPYGNRSRNDKGAINSSAEIIRQRIAGLKVERCILSSTTRNCPQTPNRLPWRRVPTWLDLSDQRILRSGGSC